MQGLPPSWPCKSALLALLMALMLHLPAQAARLLLSCAAGTEPHQLSSGQQIDLLPRLHQWRAGVYGALMCTTALCALNTCD